MGFMFDVYGKVRGQGRPKVDYNRKRVYKARNDKAWERSIREAYVNAGGPWFGDKPLSITVIVHRALPKATPIRIEFEPDIHKPDASNILKSIEDALNGIAYVDDRQIVDAHVRKSPRRRLTEYMTIVIQEVTE